MSFGAAMGALGAAEFLLNLNARPLLDQLRQVQGEIKHTTQEMAKDLEGGAEKGSSAMEKFKNPIGAATDALKGLAAGNATATAALVGLGVAAGITLKILHDLTEAYLEAAKEANQLAQETQKLELITRTSTESASAFLGLLDRYDIGASTANRAFTTLQKSMADYNEAIETGTLGGAGAKAIDDLGISLTDVNGKMVDTTEVFLRVAKAIRETDDPVKANTAGTVLLGRGFQTLAGMIGDTDEELRHYLEDALKTVSINLEQEKEIIKLYQAQKSLEEVQKGVNIQLALMGQPTHLEMVKAQTALWRIWLDIMKAMLPVVLDIQKAFQNWRTRELEEAAIWIERIALSVEQLSIKLDEIGARFKNTPAKDVLGGAFERTPEELERQAKAIEREEALARRWEALREGRVLGPEAAGHGPEGPVHGPEEVESERKKRLIDVNATRKIIADYNIAETKRETEAMIENHERHLKALEVEHDREVRNEDLRHDQKKKIIEEQERLDKAAHEAEMTRLEVAMDAELDAADATHEANIAALNAELERERDLYDARRATLELAKRGEERGAEERRDTAIKEEQKAIEERAEARRQADFQSQQSQERLDNLARDAHEANLKRIKDANQAVQDRIDDEIKGLEKTREAGTRKIQDETKAEQKRHEQRLDDLRVEREAEDDRYEDAVRNLEHEAEAARETAEDRIEGVRDASEELRDQAEAQIEGIRAASEALREQTEAQIEGIRDASEALREQHDEQVEAIRDEMEALRDKYDEQQEAIKDQQQAERQATRERMAAIDEETAKRRAAIEEQLGLLDAERQADRQAAQDRADQERLQQATEQLTTALGAGGDPADILAAQQAVADAQYQIDQHAKERSRQTQEDALEAQLDAIEKAAAAEKAALEAEQETRDAAHAAELERLEDELEAAIDNSEARIDLLDDQLDAALEINDEQIELLEDQLDAAIKVYDRQIELIERDLEKALDANERKIQGFEEERDRRLKAIDDQRETLDDDHERTIEQIEEKVRKENKAFKDYQDVQEGRRREIDDTYKLAREALEEQAEKEDRAAEDATEREKERYKNEQRQVKETRDFNAEELRKARLLEDTNSDLAMQKIKDQYDSERTQIWETYDNPVSGLFHQLDKSWTETQRTIDLRRTKEDAHYDAVKAQIEKTYKSIDPNHPGLIPVQEMAYAAIVEGHRKSKEDEQLYHEAVREKIKLTYYDESDPENPKGLITAQRKAIENLKQDLTDVITNWTNWANDTTGQIQRVIDAYNRLRDAQRDANMPTGARVPGGGGGGGGMPIPPDTVAPGGNDEWVVTFPFKAIYTGSFRTGQPHRGVDLQPRTARGKAGIGWPVRAWEYGTVSQVSTDTGPAGGRMVWVLDADGLTHTYMHLNDQSVSKGDPVYPGKVLGHMGETGTEGNPHLHYEVRKDLNGDPDSRLIDPTPWWSGGKGLARPPGEGYPADKTAAAYDQPAHVGPASREQINKWARWGMHAVDKPIEAWLDGMLNLIAVESGTRYNATGTVEQGTGNPTAVNQEGVNGEHASGLMQTLPSTFRSNVPRWMEQDIFDPVSNVAAASQYIWGRYGDPYKTPYYRTGRFDFRGVRGYAEGGRIEAPTLLVNAGSLEPYGLMAEAGPEWIMPERKALPPQLVNGRGLQPSGVLTDGLDALGGGSRDLVGAGAPAVNYHFDVRGPSMNQVARQIRRQFERSEWLHRGWR